MRITLIRWYYWTYRVHFPDTITVNNSWTGRLEEMPSATGMKLLDTCSLQSFTFRELTKRLVAMSLVSNLFPSRTTSDSSLSKDADRLLADLPTDPPNDDSPKADAETKSDQDAVKDPKAKKEKPHFRTIFISDVHLGFHGSQADELVDLLKKVRCDKLYLVGDIIDMWRLKSRWYWPGEHNDLIRKIMKMAKKGTEVVYVPGNHDEAIRQFCKLEFGGVQLRMIDTHTTADGKKLLVTHGDQFDLIVRHNRLLSVFGAIAYEWLVRINIYYNKARKLMGMKYWSLSQYMKLKVKKACTFISRFEDALVDEAKRRQLDGVVCGHIHKAEHSTIEGIEYINCGDWVESCTLALEHMDGQIEVIEGSELLQRITDEQEAKQEQAKLERESKASRKRKKLAKKVMKRKQQAMYAPPDDDGELHYATRWLDEEEDESVTQNELVAAETGIADQADNQK